MMDFAGFFCCSSWQSRTNGKKEEREEMMHAWGQIAAGNRVKMGEEERVVLYFSSWCSGIQQMTRIQAVTSDVHVMGFCIISIETEFGSGLGGNGSGRGSKLGQGESEKGGGDVVELELDLD